MSLIDTEVEILPITPQFKAIKNDQDLDNALQRTYDLMQVQEKTPHQENELEVLSILIESYESKHYQINKQPTFTLDIAEFTQSEAVNAGALIEMKVQKLLQEAQSGNLYYTQLAGLTKTLEVIADKLREHITPYVLTEISSDFTKLTWADIAPKENVRYQYNTPAILELSNRIKDLQKDLKAWQEKSQKTKEIVEEVNEETGEVFELFPAKKQVTSFSFVVSLK